MAASNTTPPGDTFLTVYSFDRNDKRYTLTQFTLKLYFRLRYGNVAYDDQDGTRQQAPKTKFPYIKFNDTGKLMGDSGLIIQRLIELGKLDDVNKMGDPKLAALDYALRALIEDKLYFFLLSERWNENYQAFLEDGPFSRHSPYIRPLSAAVAFNFVRLQLYFQGTGRHSLDELKQLRAEAIEHLGNLAASARKEHLARGDGEEPFWILGGATATEADFSLYGYLTTILATRPNRYSKQLVREQAALIDYVRRIHGRYFSDYASPFQSYAGEPEF